MHSTEAKKTLIQCDFDGTITQEDVSFLLLDAFTDGSWRQLLTEYREQRISVGYFNRKAFGMIKADRETLTKFARKKARIRSGFHQLVAYCREMGFRFTIVSNGLDFYIEAILRDLGIDDIEVMATKTRFSSEGLEVAYVGPDGNQLDEDFKEAYIRSFLKQGYRVVYVGDGLSDGSPAKSAYHVFARGDLLAYCTETNLNCTPFVDLDDVVRGLKLL